MKSFYRLLFLSFATAVPWVARGAAANEVYLLQRNAGNTANAQRVVAPVANGIFTYNGSLVPTATTTPDIGAATGTSLALTGASSAASSTLSGATANTLNYFNGSKAESSATLSGLTLTAGALAVDAATTAAAGKVELATDAEAVTGTSTTLVPSVASMRAGVAPLRNALAPAQGMLFDGSNVSAMATLGSALGTTDAAIEIEFDVPSANPATIKAVLSLGTVRSEGTANELALHILPTGVLEVFKRGAAVGDTRAANVTANLVTAHGGNRVKLAITRVGATLVLFINGLSEPYTETTGGTAPTWATTWDGTLLTLGRFGVSYNFDGFIGQPRIYNRTLTATEVKTNFEKGAPAGADYNNASNTAINLASWVNQTGYDTFTGVSATGFTTTKVASGAGSAKSGENFTAAVGQRIRVSFTATLTSGDVPWVQLGDPNVTDNSGQVTVVAGAQTVELVTTAATSSCRVLFRTNLATSFAISNIVVTRLGLLLAPDIYGGGAGTIWLDTSGNAATITLPATGVTWNTPRQGFALGTVAAPVNFAATAAGGLTITPTSGQAYTVTGGTGGTSAFTGTGAHVFGTTNTVSMTAGSLTLNANGSNIAATTVGLTQKFLWFQNTGGDAYFGIESSTAGGFFAGSAAYDTVIYSPGKPVFISTPSLKLTGDLTVSGTGTSSVAGPFTATTLNLGGSTVTDFLTATATLDFGIILAAANADLTITVTGAAVGDTVAFGLPATVLGGAVFNAWVSATNTVNVRCNNAGSISIDPASATYRVAVVQF